MLDERATNDGWVFAEVRKGMYGLLHVGLLAQDLLQERLATNGCIQSKFMTGLWTYSTKQFCLVLNYFGVKYMGRENTEHLK